MFLKIKLILLLTIFVSSLLFASDTFKVKTVYDGDTILLEDGRKLRLIGIDAPESYESEKLIFDSSHIKKDINFILEEGIKSKEFLVKLIEGKKVEIEYDIMNATNDHKDKYGRELVYVKFLMKKPPIELLKFLESEGKKVKWQKKMININALMIQCGRAFLYTKYQFKHKDDFKKFEETAKRAKIGIWENY